MKRARMCLRWEFSLRSVMQLAKKSVQQRGIHRAQRFEFGFVIARVFVHSRSIHDHACISSTITR